MLMWSNQKMSRDQNWPCSSTSCL